MEECNYVVFLLQTFNECSVTILKIKFLIFIKENLIENNVSMAVTERVIGYIQSVSGNGYNGYKSLGRQMMLRNKDFNKLKY